MPARPAAGQPRSDEAKADYVADLRGAYEDCKATVGATAARRKSLDGELKGVAAPVNTTTAAPAPAATPAKKGGFFSHIPFLGKVL